MQRDLVHRRLPRAEAALRDGLDVVAPADRVVIASIIEPLDPGLVVGSGMAGGVMTPSEALVMQSGIEDTARTRGPAAHRLGLHDAELRVLTEYRVGDLRPRHRAELGDRDRVHGSGGLRRAVRGSVSDHVVRDAT